MTLLYKLTDKNNQTHGGCQWGENVTHATDGEGGLCGPGWIHAYEHPLLAVLHNPIHGDFDPETMHLWECKGEIGKREGQMKCGTTSCTTVRRIDIPQVTTEQRIRYAILCAKQVCDNPNWNRWADRWLSGDDRTKTAAREAREAGGATGTATGAAGAAAWAAARANLDLAAIAKEAIST